MNVLIDRLELKRVQERLEVAVSDKRSDAAST